ncbi:MAG: ArsR family transcriptional regulator [Actinobacteria bacterium]|nr:MAG: ArsR family transcriptional regulator [Actinomycetota bacterium]
MSDPIFEMHAQVCKVFTSPKRLEIINAIRNSEKSAGELVEILKISQPNLSQHLAVLREKGVVAIRKEGQNIYYKIANPKIIKACDLMREVLIEKLKQDQKLAKELIKQGI